MKKSKRGTNKNVESRIQQLEEANAVLKQQLGLLVTASTQKDEARSRTSSVATVPSTVISPVSQPRAAPSPMRGVQQPYIQEHIDTDSHVFTYQQGQGFPQAMSPSLGAPSSAAYYSPPQPQYCSYSQPHSPAPERRVLTPLTTDNSSLPKTTESAIGKQGLDALVELELGARSRIEEMAAWCLKSTIASATYMLNNLMVLSLRADEQAVKIDDMMVKMEQYNRRRKKESKPTKVDKSTSVVMRKRSASPKQGEATSYAYDPRGMPAGLPFGYSSPTQMQYAMPAPSIPMVPMMSEVPAAIPVPASPVHATSPVAASPHSASSARMQYSQLQQQLEQVERQEREAEIKNLKLKAELERELAKRTAAPSLHQPVASLEQVPVLPA